MITNEDGSEQEITINANERIAYLTEYLEQNPLPSDGNGQVISKTRRKPSLFDAGHDCSSWTYVHHFIGAVQQPL